MKVHANAALGPAGRLALVQAIESGMTQKAAAAAFCVAPATAHAGGIAGAWPTRSSGALGGPGRQSPEAANHDPARGPTRRPWPTHQRSDR
jgi:hypothetical protein